MSRLAPGRGAELAQDVGAVNLRLLQDPRRGSCLCLCRRPCLGPAVFPALSVIVLEDRRDEGDP